MSVGLLTLHLQIPGCRSLKEKRSRLKPLIARLRKEFNVSVAEMDFQDTWQDCLLMIATVGNHQDHTQRSLRAVTDWIEQCWPDVTIVNDSYEFL
ncbi:MAG: DUF503 domain-containing protein [Anaerolineales bacterium]|nr:DUF503 domain-containing protein [Anaerolineales bacterium]MCS7248032.1 DUF503 domain-containing protein [Anaerolineales bacterium]MDW8161844.1 DUF503 domain-containing protein [Anaerolineales bacterium]MDW8446606.1 DUF503 domain-containing protein [Anaerolineales bacterium]